jgi:hypothetical protein
MFRLVNRFIEHEGGSLTTAFVSVLIPVTLAIGASIDYLRASQYQTALQSALDSAVLAGAVDGSSNWTTTATNTFNANFSGSQYGTTPVPNFSFDASTSHYTGAVTGSQTTLFLAIAQISSLSIAASASVLEGSGPDNSCILTYDRGNPKSDVSFTLNGAPNVNLAGCGIRSNTSLTCNGHDGQTASALAAGTASGCGHPQSNARTVPDIYASLAANITKQCGASLPGVTWVAGSIPSGPAVIKLTTANYAEYHICGTLTLSGSGYLTGNTPTSDTVIVVENGSLNIASNATISGVRTTIVMTGNNSYASQIVFPNGNGHAASLTLSPSTSAGNPWQGVALYQDPSLTYSVDDSWGPGATFNADGLVYLSNSNVTMKGNAASGSAQCTKLVVNSFTSDGAVNLALDQSASKCSAIGLIQDSGVPPRVVE